MALGLELGFRVSPKTTKHTLQWTVAIVVQMSSRVVYLTHCLVHLSFIRTHLPVKQRALLTNNFVFFGCHFPCQIANGYLVGACLAHYYPRMLDNEEFNRGNSPANRAANWDFVQKFTKRRGYGLRRQNIEILCMVRPVSQLPSSVDCWPRWLVEMDAAWVRSD